MVVYGDKFLKAFDIMQSLMKEAMYTILPIRAVKQSLV